MAPVSTIILDDRLLIEELLVGLDADGERHTTRGNRIGSCEVFDIDAGRQLGRDLPLRVGGTSRVAFSADGAILAVPTAGGITLWNFDTDTWADIACQTAGRNLTRDEWDRFGPRAIEYRATCPHYPIERDMDG